MFMLKSARKTRFQLDDVLAPHGSALQMDADCDLVFVCKQVQEADDLQGLPGNNMVNHGSVLDGRNLQGSFFHRACPHNVIAFPAPILKEPDERTGRCKPAENNKRGDFRPPFG